MCTAPYSINESSSIARTYRFFRTMGLRHLVVLDDQHRVTGMVTRKDITESHLEHHWEFEGEEMQKYLTVGDRCFEEAAISAFEQSGVAVEQLDIPVNNLSAYSPPPPPTFQTLSSSVGGGVYAVERDKKAAASKREEREPRGSGF
jgi:hypothetical protein